MWSAGFVSEGCPDDGKSVLADLLGRKHGLLPRYKELLPRTQNGLNIRGYPGVSEGANTSLLHLKIYHKSLICRRTSTDS